MMRIITQNALLDVENRLLEAEKMPRAYGISDRTTDGRGMSGGNASGMAPKRSMKGRQMTQRLEERSLRGRDARKTVRILENRGSVT